MLVVQRPDPAADVQIYQDQLAEFRASALTGAEAIEFVRSRIQHEGILMPPSMR
jgi:hypothetical protein